ncbi:hypothetical protein DdX_13838 [Ditylenchus destructor]|uniref:Uncharacterized protein n=1 Tax=Ditylenchus destructor TaxID=166010 RepID=A0AAD4QZ51_9BILA|nr:hypothetical protein DdX_13838 [Ditylenchus destructor]
MRNRDILSLNAFLPSQFCFQLANVLACETHYSQRNRSFPWWGNSANSKEGFAEAMQKFIADRSAWDYRLFEIFRKKIEKVGLRFSDGVRSYIFYAVRINHKLECCKRKKEMKRGSGKQPRAHSTVLGYFPLPRPHRRYKNERHR